MKDKIYSGIIVLVLFLIHFTSNAEYFLQTYIPRINMTNYPTVELYLIINDFEGQESIIGAEDCKDFNNTKCYSLEIKENSKLVKDLLFKHFKKFEKNTEVLIVKYTSKSPKDIERILDVKIGTPFGSHNYNGESFRFLRTGEAVVPAILTDFAEYVEQIYPRKTLSKVEIENIVMDIRVKYKEIQNGLNRYTKSEKDYTIAGGSGSIITYYLNDEIRKMMINFDGDGASGSTEYFFWDDKLFFIFDKWETSQIWEEQTNVGVTENRYYYNNFRLTRWLVKSFEDDYKPHYKSMDNKNFRDAEKINLKNTDEWQQFMKSENSDFDSFLEGR